MSAGESPEAITGFLQIAEGEVDRWEGAGVMVSIWQRLGNGRPSQWRVAREGGEHPHVYVTLKPRLHIKAPGRPMTPREASLLSHVLDAAGVLGAVVESVTERNAKARQGT